MEFSFSDNFKKFMGLDEESRGTGISPQSAAAIHKLDEDMKEKPKEEPKAQYTETGKTQKEVFTETFGEGAADRKAKAQEEKRKELMRGR